jgi:hypothetical protein
LSDSEFFSKSQSPQFFDYENFKEPELLVILKNQMLHNTGLQNSLQGKTNLGNPDNRVHQQFGWSELAPTNAPVEDEPVQPVLRMNILPA